MNTMTAAMPPPGHLLIALLAAVVIAGVARAVKALSVSGMVAATLVGAAIFGFGGWPGATALLLFFVSSTALGRVGRRRKEAVGFEKGGERDAAQVLANGGVAAICALLLPLFPHHTPLTVAALLGALAEANADTWATEIGTLAARPPLLITTLRRAAPGRSGAISAPGTFAAFCGALLVAGTSPLWHLSRWEPLALAALLGGFVGALADSVLGATVQAQYRCRTCGRLTERRTHCEERPTVLEYGFRWLKNDGVNALATLIGATSALLVARMFF